MSPLRFWRSLTGLGRVIAALMIIAALIWAGLFVRSLFVGNADVKADLAEEQAGAAIKSGQDAVGTVSDQSTREDERDRSVDEMKDKVDEAETADDAHAAGAGWLCLDFGIC